MGKAGHGAAPLEGFTALATVPVPFFYAETHNVIQSLGICSWEMVIYGGVTKRGGGRDPGSVCVTGLIPTGRVSTQKPSRGPCSSAPEGTPRQRGHGAGPPPGCRLLLSEA